MPKKGQRKRGVNARQTLRYSSEPFSKSIIGSEDYYSCREFSLTECKLAHLLSSIDGIVAIDDALYAWGPTKVPYCITSVISSDDGATWRYMSRLCQYIHFPNIVTTLNSSGKLIVNRTKPTISTSAKTSSNPGWINHSICLVSRLLLSCTHFLSSTLSS